MSQWHGILHRRRIILGGGGSGGLQTWDLSADPIDEPDGGTFYSDAGTDGYISLSPLVYSGTYLLPGYTLSVQGTANSYLEFYDEDQNLISTGTSPIDQGHLICADAIATSWSRAYEYVITLPEPAYFARWKVVGDDELYWDGGGSMTRFL